MEKVARRKWLAAGLSALAIAIARAGCSPDGLFGLAGGQQARSSTVLTEHVPPSLLVSASGERLPLAS